jgi:hypothetical protein
MRPDHGPSNVTILACVSGMHNEEKEYYDNNSQVHLTSKDNAAVRSPAAQRRVSLDCLDIPALFAGMAVRS